MENKGWKLLKKMMFIRNKCMICGNSVQTKLPIFKNAKNDMHKEILMSDHFCISCKLQLYIPDEPFCKHCHKSLSNSNLSDDNQLCSDCNADNRKHLDVNRSVVFYNYFIKEKITLFKYKGDLRLAKPFGYLLYYIHNKYYLDKGIDTVTFVPIHPTRLEERTFNQAEQMAKYFRKYSGLTLKSTLKRVKNTEKQSKRNKRERMEQVDGTFIFDDDALPYIKNRNILIIDDIYTTGATLEECAKVLKEAGAKKVYSLTLARATESALEDNIVQINY